MRKTTTLSVRVSGALGDHVATNVGEDGAYENVSEFATVNYAIENPIAGTALIDPDGAVCASHLRGTEHVLVADIDKRCATGLLAKRLRPA